MFVTDISLWLRPVHARGARASRALAAGDAAPARFPRNVAEVF
jgi:hypothetical protein